MILAQAMHCLPASAIPSPEPGLDGSLPPPPPPTEGQAADGDTPPLRLGAEQLPTLEAHDDRFNDFAGVDWPSPTTLAISGAGADCFTVMRRLRRDPAPFTTCGGCSWPTLRLLVVDIA